MITDDAYSKKAFSALKKALSKTELIDLNVDSIALQFLAKDIAIYLRAYAELDELTKVHRTDRGSINTVKNPVFDIYIKTGDQIHKQLAQFGLTPKSRKQILEELKSEGGEMSEIYKLMKGGK